MILHVYWNRNLTHQGISCLKLIAQKGNGYEEDRQFLAQAKNGMIATVIGPYLTIWTKSSGITFFMEPKEAMCTKHFVNQPQEKIEPVGQDRLLFGQKLEASAPYPQYKILSLASVAPS